MVVDIGSDSEDDDEDEVEVEAGDEEAGDAVAGRRTATDTVVLGTAVKAPLQTPPEDQ